MNSISNLIYFNNNRTTQTDPSVLESMSIHKTGGTDTDARHLTEAEQKLAELINAAPGEILFTSGTTESVYLALKGAFGLYKSKGKHVITNVTEHFAVLDCLQELKQEGAEITYLPVDKEGLIDPDDLKNAIRPDTIMVSIMAANNETGVIQPIERISEICRERTVFFFSDASQYIGKLRCDVKELGFDSIAFGAHKMYGPEGVGLLYISEYYAGLMAEIKNTKRSPIDLSRITGFAKAAELSAQSQWDVSTHVSKLKAYLEHQLLDIDGLRINGSTRHRLYNTSNLTFPENKNIASLLNRFDFADNLKKPSYVLRAMGLSDEEIKNSYRFSFGKYNTLEEVKLLVHEVLNML